MEGSQDSSRLQQTGFVHQLSEKVIFEGIDSARGTPHDCFFLKRAERLLHISRVRLDLVVGGRGI